MKPLEQLEASTTRLGELRGSKHLKVCHVVATTEGAPWMFEQLRELRNQYGFDVTAVVSGEHGKLIDQLDSEGIPHFATSFEFATRHGMMRIPRAVFNLARFFRQQQFDVIQTHIFVSMVLGRFASWLADVPVRLSMIAGPFHLEAHTSRWIDRVTCFMETMLIPTCEDSLRLCREMGVRDDQLELIYYSADEKNFDPARTLPVNIRQQFGWPPEAPVVGMVAYFYPRLSNGTWIPDALRGRGVKGHDDLINAVPLVQAEFPGTKFLFVGSGWGEAGNAYIEELKALVASLNLQDSVSFAGYHSDVSSVLREVDVAVQASLSENLGGTLEALLMECPLVATRVGGMVDTVRDGLTGILVEPSSPTDLARGIKQMLRDPERARELGRAGRRLILERFSLNRTVQDEAELYQRLALKALSKRRHHRLLVSLWRAILAVPVFAYVAFRVLFIDMFLPVYLPIYLARVRSVPYRVYNLLRLAAYRVVGLACLLRTYACRMLSRILRVRRQLGFDPALAMKVEHPGESTEKFKGQDS